MAAMALAYQLDEKGLADEMVDHFKRISRLTLTPPVKEKNPRTAPTVYYSGC